MQLWLGLYKRNESFQSIILTFVSDVDLQIATVDDVECRMFKKCNKQRQTEENITSKLFASCLFTRYTFVSATPDF